MAHKLIVMCAFQKEYRASSPIEACRMSLSEDTRLIEPPELPKGRILGRAGQGERNLPSVWDVNPSGRTSTR